MQTAIINFRTEPKTKKQAQKVAEELGFSLSTVMNGFLKQLIKTKMINFNMEERPSPYLLRALKESHAQVERGEVVTFKNGEEALKYLDQMIANDRKKHKNSLQQKIHKTARKSSSRN